LNDKLKENSSFLLDSLNKDEKLLILDPTLSSHGYQLLPKMNLPRCVNFWTSMSSSLKCPFNCYTVTSVTRDTPDLNLTYEDHYRFSTMFLALYMMTTSATIVMCNQEHSESLCILDFMGWMLEINLNFLDFILCKDHVPHSTSIKIFNFWREFFLYLKINCLHFNSALLFLFAFFHTNVQMF
jgi:hypothetical protein